MLRRNNDQKAVRPFFKTDRVCAKRARGQALVELAVAIPMIFLLIALAFNFGTWLYGWVAVGNAARAAGDYAILSGSSAGLPPTATKSTLQSLINTDLTYLPNTSSSNPNVCIQENNNGTITKMLDVPSGPSGACATANAAYGSAPVDPEAKVTGGTLTYPSVTVDITYTFTPFFFGSKILGLPLTVLPTTIHRRTVMRIL